MAERSAHGEPDWVHGHAHEPNPPPPAGDGSLTLRTSKGGECRISVDELYTLPRTVVADCYVVSTGHGTSGPFAFGGVHLGDLLVHALGSGARWRHVDVVSRDGFGTRLTPADLSAAPADRPILLAYEADGAPLSHQRGLVRLIVPTETDDALKQVKWVEQIEVAL